MSPGTVSSSGRTTCPPAIEIRWAPSSPSAPAASDRTSTPRARSMRSVWSRVAVASVTDVTPSAARPASRMADFTWALGTAVVQSIDRSGARPVTRERREGRVVGAVDRGAHGPQGLRHAPHRPAAERGIAVERHVQRRARQEAGQEAHRRARVAAVQRSVGRPPCRPTRRGDPPVDGARPAPSALDGHAECSQAGRGAARIEGPRGVGDARGPLGHGGQEQGAVGDRLVGWHAQAAAQAGRLGHDGQVGRVGRGGGHRVARLNAWTPRRSPARRPRAADRAAGGRSARGAGRPRPSGRGTRRRSATARRRREPPPVAGGPPP